MNDLITRIREMIALMERTPGWQEQAKASRAYYWNLLGKYLK